MGSLSEKKIIEKSKEYYSKPENVRKKWFDQYGKISADNNYYDNKKCIDEVFNLVDVVMDLKLDEFRMEAYRLPDDIIDNKVNEVYLYKGKKITFWPTTSFLSKVIALRKTGYKISTDLDKKIRVIRNATTHGNSIVKNEDRDGLNALFIRSEDTQAEIDKFYNKVKEYNEKDYEETYFYNICSSENHHGVGVFSWEVYSGHPDDNYLANSFFLTLSPSEDGWKLDETNETAVLLGESDDIKKIWTSEMINAVNEGRNYHIFDTEDYTWNERYITIPGVFSKQGCIMWQEEDGTVILKLNFKNGTDKVMKLNSLNVTAQDSRLGTIFENIGVRIENGYVDEIEPGESKNMDLTINSDYILTAEDTWSDDIRLDIDAEYAE